MRIALLVTDHQRGGTPLRLARLAVGLRERGVEVVAGCLAPPGPVSGDLERSGVATFACDARGPTDAAALWRLARHIRDLRPDLLHATLTHANVAARVVGWVLRVPVIGSTATIEVERPLHRVLERRTAFLDALHIVNSRAVARHVEECYGISAARIRITPPLTILPKRLSEGWLSESERPATRRSPTKGWSPTEGWSPSGEHESKTAARRALGLPAEATVVAWVGRFDPAKRVERLVRAAAEAPCRALHFLLAGDGPLRPRIEALARELGVAPRVHLCGWLDDVSAALCAADLFALPSRTEGMPNAVLEALAHGLPVIGSDIPALRELAEDGAPIELVAEVDAAARENDEGRAAAPAWAQRLAALAADVGERQSRSTAALAWAHARLDPDRAVDTHVAVYEEILVAAGDADL